MKYLGYNVLATPSTRYVSEVSGGMYEYGYSCEIYNVGDDEMQDQLDTFFIPYIDEKTVDMEMRKYINTNYYRLKSERKAVACERLNNLLGRLIRNLCDNLGEREAYKHLKEFVGMKDEEIISSGAVSLAKYFDQISYAQTIAEYMIRVGTANTISGNYHFEFEEINKLFGVNLPNNVKLKEAIEEHLWNNDEVVSDLNSEEDFDLMFFLHFCPNAEDNDETNDLEQTVL